MSEGAGSFPLEDFMEREARRVETALERAVESLLPSLAPKLRPPVRQGVMAGGKRLRPILCQTSYEACGGTNRRGIEDLAVSVELIHAYSLMHDDLPCMDDADLRRGLPTPHTLHGVGPTAVGAAALIPAAHLQLWRAASAMGLSPEIRRRLLEVLSRAAGGEGMVDGQALDLLGEGRSLEREELDRLHGRKTGALLTAPLEMGALAAGASARERSALREYGAALGLAFQIADDVLDATADAASLGKNPSDRELRKSTYVALLGVRGARTEALGLVDRARNALVSAQLDSPALRELARFVVARDR